MLTMSRGNAAIDLLVWSCRRRASLLLSLLFVVIVPYSSAQASSNTSDFLPNRRFDPRLPEVAVCTIPPYQNTTAAATYLPPPSGYCPEGVGDLSLDDLDSLAVEYAPVLFFHPLEKYTLQSVDRTFADLTAGQIIFDQGAFSEVFDEELNLTSLLFSTRDLDVGINSGDFFFQRQLDDAYLAGAGFNESGYSKASVYYNSYEWYNGTVVFNYHFYYAYRGYASMVLLSSANGTLRQTQFLAPPYGSHEGDWQSIRVMACKSATASLPIAVSYRQGSWTQITDCTAGDCIFYLDTYHPVGFVALESHSSYPMSAESIILDSLQTDSFLDLQGVVAVDRTKYLDENGSYRVFFPDISNVIRHKEQAEIVLGVTDSSVYWQGFAGVWGNASLDSPSNLTAICLDENQTSFADCPTEEEDPVFTLCLELLGILPPSNIIVRASNLLFNSATSAFSETGKSPRGPVTEPQYSSWEEASNALLWRLLDPNTTAKEHCANVLIAPHYDPQAPAVDVIPLQSNTTKLIIFCVLVMLANMVLFAGEDCFRSKQPPLRYDSDGVLQPPGLRFKYFLLRTSVLYTLAYSFSMIGVALFLVGFNALDAVLAQYLGINSLDHFRKVVQTCVVFLVTVDTVFLVFLWIQAYDIWLKVESAYCNAVGLATTESRERRMLRCSKYAVYFHVAHGVLFACVIFAALIVLFACFNIGLAYGFGQVCRLVSGAAYAICFSLKVFGIKDVACGTEFQDFCNQFAQDEIVTTFWGSFITCAGHFYILSSASAASMNFRVTTAIIAILHARTELERELSLQTDQQSDIAEVKC